MTATRAVFDHRGARDARVDEIARAAGLNKALIYRVFTSKQEIFVRAATSYLDELREQIDAMELSPDPADALRQLLDVFTDFCITYPAFLDSGLSLLHYPSGELREMLSDGAWFRISRAVARCVGTIQRTLQAGSDAGVFGIDEDAGFVAGRLLTEMMGGLHLARLGVSVQEATPGVVSAISLTPEQVKDACIRDALAIVSTPTARPQ